MSTSASLSTSAAAATKSAYVRRPRRFAPLNPELAKLKEKGENLTALQGVVFDVDGTLCEPQNYMFGQMRAALNIQKPTDILDHIYSLPAGEQEAAMESIRNIEREAMKTQRAQPGLVQLMEYLTKRGVKKAICTRNFDAPVNHLLSTFVPSELFEPIITREFRPPKPSPAGILHIASSWTLDNAENLLMVGDSIDDMAAGRAAGATTVLLVNSENEKLGEHEFTDVVVSRLDELVDVLEEGLTVAE